MKYYSFETKNVTFEPKKEEVQDMISGVDDDGSVDQRQSTTIGTIRTFENFRRLTICLLAVAWPRLSSWSAQSPGRPHPRVRCQKRVSSNLLA